MNAQDFAYWLQGFFEIQNPETLDEKQTQIIKDHLALVFTKVTPQRDGMEEVRMFIKESRERSEKIPTFDYPLPVSPTTEPYNPFGLPGVTC